MIDSTSAPHTSNRRSSDASEEIRPLTAAVISVREVTETQRAEMFALFARYFTADRASFEHDLEEKESVVLLTDDQAGVLAGFSTLMRFEMTAQSRPITVFFSGDTIVDRQYWGTPALPRAWSRHVFECAATLSHDAYWFLISSGFRTYRYLPVFFRRFSPSPDGMQTTERRLLDEIAVRKYGRQYDPQTGVVRLDHRTPLRHPATEEAIRRAGVDPSVRFFLERNPRHAEGDELACLVRISRDNLTPAGRRMLRG